MADVDRRALMGTLMAVGAASAASAQPVIKPLSDLKKEADAACVYHVDYGDAPRFVQTLTNISNHYSAYGANPFDLQIALVAHGQGVKFFFETLENTPWKEEVMVPQIFERIAAVAKNGLKVHLCNITFERLKLDHTKVRKADFISFVPSGVATVAALQGKGFAYIKIG
jgi:uncharacterized protein